MMNQFRVRYIPGGMSLNHSGWWLVEQVFHSGVNIEVPVRYLKRSDYA